MKKLVCLTVLLLCAFIAPLASAQEEMVQEPEIITTSEEMAQEPEVTTTSMETVESVDALASFYELEMILGSLGGALDRYNGGSSINCAEFLAHNAMLENLPMFADATGIWKDLVAIYHKAAAHGHDAVKDVVLACENDSDGHLMGSELSTANWGWARQGINEALEVLRPAIIVGEENSDAAPEAEDMPADMDEEMDMPEDGDDMDMPAVDDGDCVIPSVGAWPACATDAGQPESTADCMVPESGPWPECAKSLPQPSAVPAPVVEEEMMDEEVVEEEVVEEEMTESATDGTNYSNAALSIQVPEGWIVESEVNADEGSSITYIAMGAGTVDEVVDLPSSIESGLLAILTQSISKAEMEAIVQELELNSIEELELVLTLDQAIIDEEEYEITIHANQLATGKSIFIANSMRVMDDGVDIHYLDSVFYDEATEQLYTIIGASKGSNSKTGIMEDMLETMTPKQIPSNDIIVVPQLAAPKESLVVKYQLLVDELR